MTTVGQEAIQSFGELLGKKSSQPIDGSSKLIVDLILALDKAVGETSKLLSGRKGTKGGRPTDPELKFYTAVVASRPTTEEKGRTGVIAS